MNLFPNKMHLFTWGCILFFASNATKRSVLIEDDNIRLLEIMNDGSVKDWGEIRPDQTIDVPDGVLLEFENKSKDDSMTLIEEDKPDLPINIEHQESVALVESDTGNIGFEKRTADGTVKLITSSKNYNQLHSTEESIEATAERKTKRTTMYTRTITQIPPRTIADSYPTYDTPIPEQTFTTENNWLLYTAIGGGCVVLWALGLYYLLQAIKAGARYLHQDDLWSAWRSEEPYDVLLMIKPEHLADKLVHDITVTYYQVADPIALFLQDIKEEYDTLVSWIQFRNQLSHFYISLGEAFDMIEHRLMLLEHMRKTVHYWRAQQLSTEKA